MKSLRDAILPTVMCTAAVSGNVDKLKEAVKQVGIIPTLLFPIFDIRSPSPHIITLIGATQQEVDLTIPSESECESS